MKASSSSCQPSIQYSSTPTTSSLYLSTFAGYEFNDVVSEKLSRLLSRKETLIFRLIRFLVLKSFSMPLSYDSIEFKELDIKWDELILKEFIRPSI